MSYVIEVLLPGKPPYWSRFSPGTDAPDYRKAKDAYNDARARWVASGYRQAVRIRRHNGTRAVHMFRPLKCADAGRLLRDRLANEGP
jgi:hypothetical protein